MAKKDTPQNRPLSPHLQVYKPQITSMLSITHRMTEVAIFIGLFVLAGLLYSLLGDSCCYNWLIGLAHTTLGQLVLVGFTLAMFYNVAYAVRHFFWTMGKGFELSTVTKSGIAVLAFTVVMTALFWSVIWKVV